MGVLYMLSGFVLTIVGLWLHSIPLALIVAGVLLFISGGLELRRATTLNEKHPKR